MLLRGSTLEAGQLRAGRSYRGPPKRPGVTGQRRTNPYRARVVTTDLVVVVLTSVGVGFAARSQSSAGMVGFWSAPVILIGVWLLVLSWSGVWDLRLLGRGVNEFRHLGSAAQLLICAVGVLAYVTRAQFGRAFLIAAVPVGIVGVLLSHLGWRQWLAQQRKRGRMLTSVLVVGHATSARYLARRLQHTPQSGYRVVGLCIPEEDTDPGDPDFELLGLLDDIPEAIARTGAGAVAVASCDQFGPAQVRTLAWRLEGTGVRLIVTPSLVDVSGPRIHITQVSGLPLMQVEGPRFDGPTLMVKSTFDVIAALCGLLVLSPGLMVAAIAIKLGDGGPIFFRQPRVGLGGRTFQMWKFRSMRVDAERRLAGLKIPSQGNQVLFKLRQDPRITPVGRVLRRLSIDEVPQLLNVVMGQMSLVGPRPPLVSEVALYRPDVHRRFLVKPGLTGPWQVGGRSDLSWDESVRLDLYYVENWSFVGDVAILAKTARAVLSRNGAY